LVQHGFLFLSAPSASSAANLEFGIWNLEFSRLPCGHMAGHRFPLAVLRSCLPALLPLALWGCCSIPPPQKAETIGTASSNAPPKVVAYFPKRPYDFSACQKLNPIWWLGNADEPDPPDWYRPNKSCRKIMWHFRNPCHNFTFFVIGIADRPFTRAGRFPG